MPHIDTELQHGDMGFSTDGAITPSILFTATFVARDAKEFAEMASVPQHSRYYTRYGNPLHERIGHLVATLGGLTAVCASLPGWAASLQAVCPR